MRILFLFLCSTALIWADEDLDEEPADYHRVIDELAKALSDRALNVSRVLEDILEGKQRPNLSAVALTPDQWPDSSVYHLPRPSHRPSLITESRVTVPSQRLLNDILVVRSSRRLYLLVLSSVHESLNMNGYECGQIDVNSMIRLGALLSSVDEINENLLKPDLHLGVIVVDTCSSDLRTLANLYELFMGTNIQRTDIVSVILDDQSYLPITDKYLEHLDLPIIRTFFPQRKEKNSVSVLPAIIQPIEAMLDLLKYTESSCVSVIFDEAFADFVPILSDLAFERYMCVDVAIGVNSSDGVSAQQQTIRKLLISEARVVLVLYTERSWIDFCAALTEEMVISGRFILLSIHDGRWRSSRAFVDIWPKFDQLLLSVSAKTHKNATFIDKLNAEFPKLPFPLQWLRQFWTTAFKCHFSGEQFFGEQFSRICPTTQSLDLEAIEPSLNVGPISFAVYSVGYSLRRLVESSCPGALVRSLTDCLSDPYPRFFQLLNSVSFPHPLATEKGFTMNGTDGSAKTELLINRVAMEEGIPSTTELAVWDSEGGLIYSSSRNLFVEDRDGSRVRIISQCPKSSCWKVSAVKRTAKNTPHLTETLFNLQTLGIMAAIVCWAFVCLLCTYQKMISSHSDPFWVCSTLSLVGTAMSALSASLFVIVPTDYVCALRLTVVSFSLAVVLAPMFVRIISNWNYHTISMKNEVVGNNRNISTFAQFWSSAMLVVVQFFLLIQWALFDDLDEMHFAQFDCQFAWRCVGGAASERLLIRSALFVGLLSILAFGCSVFRCSNRDGHVALLSLNTLGMGAVVWYVAPQLGFALRDHLLMGVLIWHSIFGVFTMYCFAPKYLNIELGSDGTLLTKRGTLPHRIAPTPLDPTEYTGRSLRRVVVGEDIQTLS